MWTSLKRAIFKPGQEMDNLRQEVLSLLDPRMGLRNMLDVGCGEGEATCLYAAKLRLPFSSVHGIEPQEKYKHLPPFQVHSLDIERQRFPFDDESFDLVICNQVLEHLKIVIQPLREMARILRPKGRLLLGVPNLASLMSRMLLAMGRDPICLPFPGPHIRGFTHGSFLKFLTSNPRFKLLRTSGSAFYPLPPFLGEPAARMFPGLACYTLYLFQKEKHDPGKDWPAGEYVDESLTG
jgi:SAM-dependent methyltransferase